MKLEPAKVLIAAALGRMHALYGKTVFDEWVIVSLQAGAGGLRAYQGPRPESFRRQFASDVGPLRAEMAGKQFEIGDFEFAREAAGPGYDACLRIGGASYLLCNHTGKSMAEIRQDPGWLQAQKAFVELSDQFRQDPLE